MIKDLQERDDASGTYFVKEATKIDRGNDPYMNLILQDGSGVVDAKKWHVSAQDEVTLQPCNLITITGEMLMYKGKKQLRVDSCEISDSKEDLANFLVPSPVPIDELITRFRSYVKSITTPELKTILNEVFKRYYTQFIDYPAAVRNHHEFYHGLIYHTVYMCDLAEQVAKIYNDVNRDLLISGCLLHDVGKVIELSGPLATKYTTEGNLLGHLSIGMSIVREIAHENNITGDYPLILEHMILSHHGKLEYGSCVLPMTREALLLSMIDDLDSKMMILDKAYADIGKGEYTDRIFALDNRSFYKGDY